MIQIGQSMASGYYLRSLALLSLQYSTEIIFFKNNLFHHISTFRKNSQDGERKAYVQQWQQLYCHGGKSDSQAVYYFSSYVPPSQPSLRCIKRSVYSLPIAVNTQQAGQPSNTRSLLLLILFPFSLVATMSQEEWKWGTIGQVNYQHGEDLYGLANVLYR